MNYTKLLETLKNEIPNLQLRTPVYGEGIWTVTERYPEAISLQTNEKGEYEVVTGDTAFPFQTDNIKAVEFFVKKCKQLPAK